jgi:hypothetical protein
MQVCLLCVLSFLRRQILTKSVRRKERSLSIKRKETRDKPTKASHLLDAYLNPTITLCIAYSCSLIYAFVFYIAIDL